MAKKKNLEKLNIKQKSFKKGTKAKFTKATIEAFDIFHSDVSREDLYEIRRTLAKQVNQRARRIKAGKSLVTGESIAQDNIGFYAEYEALVRDTGRSGFSEAFAPSGYGKEELRREIAQLQSLLEMKSSTVKGYHEIERKRMETFEEYFGLSQEITHDKDFYDFLKTEDFKTMSKTFDSGQIVSLMKQSGRKAGEMAEALKKAYKEYKDNDSMIKGFKDFKNLYNANLVSEE